MALELRNVVKTYALDSVEVQALRGVSFVDAKGDNAFSVFLPESQKPTPAEVAQFEKTRALLQGLPRACAP